MGNAIGGSFDAAGWTVTGRTDRIWYAIPRLVTGSVEFTVDHVSLASLALDDHEIFSMYEDGFGIGEPLTYGSYRENHYKIMIRAYGALSGRPGYMKFMWGMCPSGAPGFGPCGCASFFEEPLTPGALDWDGAPHRFRFEWGSGHTRLLRDGTEILASDWTGYTFGPSDLHLALGSARADAVGTAGMPIGAVYSDLLVDGTEGALATCPGSTVPDAGPMTTDAGAGLMVMDFPAIEDVMVDPAHPTTVYPDVTDLSVGAGDSEFYVKFRIDTLPGRVVGARLVMNSAMSTSATGSGASVFAAASNSWSETSLVWNARPGGTGARLARVDGVTVNEQYLFDLPSGTVTVPAVYAFAVLPAATDSDAAHFDSKEVSPARGPILRLTIDPSMPAVTDAGVDAGEDAGVDANDVATPNDVAMVPTDTGLLPRRDAGTDAARGSGPLGGCACHTPPDGRKTRGLAVLVWLGVALAYVSARRHSRA